MTNIFMISGGGTVPLPNHGWFFDEAKAQEKCSALNADMPNTPYYEVMAITPGEESTPGVWMLTYVDRDIDNYDRSTVKEDLGWFPTEAAVKEAAEQHNAENDEWNRIHNPHLRHSSRSGEHWGYTEIDASWES